MGLLQLLAVLLSSALFLFSPLNLAPNLTRKRHNRRCNSSLTYDTYLFYLKIYTINEMTVYKHH